MTTILIRMFLLLSFLLVTSCDKMSASEKIAAELLTKAPVKVEKKYDGDGERLIYLIGENHASVANQLELVKLLDVLHRDYGISTILVEGSNGPFDLSKVRGQLTKEISAKELQEHLKTQLEWGRIAGYEYTALTSDDIVVQGVEDMSEKLLYGINSTAADSSSNRLEIESLRFGLLRIRKVRDDAKQKSDIGIKTSTDFTNVDSGIVAFEKTIDDFEHAIKIYSDATQPLRDKQQKIAKALVTLKPAFKKYGSDLSGIVNIQKEYSSKVQAYKIKFEELKRKVKQYNSSASSGRTLPDGTNRKELNKLLIQNGIDPNSEMVRQMLQNYSGNSLESDGGVFGIEPSISRSELESMQRSLTTAKSRIEYLQNQLETFNDHYGKAYSVVTDPQNKTLSTEVEAAIKSAGEQRSESRSKVEDAFAYLENQLVIVARPLEVDVSPIKNFWSETTKWLSEQNVLTAEASLRGRDSAMAENALQYLQEHNISAAAMIVGYAHVQSLATLFQKNGVSHVGLRLNSSDNDIEAWENRAWEQRIDPENNALYSKSQNKEKSLLLNDMWLREEASKLDLFSRLPQLKLKDASSQLVVHENLLGDQQVIITTRIPPDRNANFGDFRADYGPVPGRPGEYYQIFDRAKAKSEVEEFSNDQTLFAYAFRTDGPSGKEYKINIPAGEINAKDFINSPPHTVGEKVPERVVLFREPDEQQRGSITFSPLVERMRSSAGGGGRNGPPPGNRGGTAAEAPEPGPENASSGNGGGNNRTGGGDNGSGGNGNGPYWSHAWLIAAPLKAKQKPTLYQTINPKRAQENLKILDHQKGKKLGEVQFIEEESLSSLPFSPRSGKESRTVILRGSNTPEFRAQIREAAKNGQLRNKQVALITCGDAFSETSALREAILDGGAAMVWVPERQLDISQGQKLRNYVKTIVEELGSEGETKLVDELMRRALQRWEKESESDPSLRLLEQSSTWVRLEKVNPETLHRG